MCAICYAMEFLALGVHFASRQDAGYGTSSACYCAENNTIYVTSQSPPQTYYALAMMPGVDSVQAARTAIDQWLRGGVMTRGMQTVVKDLPTRTNHAPATALTMKKGKTGEHHHYSLAWAMACFGVGMQLSAGKRNLDEVMAEPDGDQGMAELFNHAPAVKIVLNEDIFAHGVSADQGFHGESRILRYLAIKQLRQHITGKTMTTGGTLEAQFKTRFAGNLHMGSNRPACADCAHFMDSLGVHCESRTGTASASEHAWVHPFTLNQGGDTITPVAQAHVAARAAGH